jgi:hypothetical protein
MGIKTEITPLYRKKDDGNVVSIHNERMDESK